MRKDRSLKKSIHRKKEFTDRFAILLSVCVVFCNLFFAAEVVRGEGGIVETTLEFLNMMEPDCHALLATASEPETSTQTPESTSPTQESSVPESTTPESSVPESSSVPKTDPKEYDVDISSFSFNPDTYPDVRVYIGYQDYRDDIQLITKVPVKTIADYSDTSGWYSFGRKENGNTDKGYDRLAAGMRVSEFVDLALEMAGEEMGDKLDISEVNVQTIGYESHNDHLYRYIDWDSLMQPRYSYPSEGYEDRYDYETPVDPIFAVVDNYQPGHAPRMLFGMTGPDDTETVGKYMVNNIGYVYLYLPVPQMRLVDSDGSDTADIDIGVRSAKTLRVRFDAPTTQMEGRLARRVRCKVTGWPEDGSKQDISVGYSTTENKLKILGTKEGDYTVELYLDKNEDNCVSLDVHVLEYVPDEEDDFSGYNADDEDLDIIDHTVAESEESSSESSAESSEKSSEEITNEEKEEGSSAETGASTPDSSGGSGSGTGTAGIRDESSEVPEETAETSGEEFLNSENIQRENVSDTTLETRETATKQETVATKSETVAETKAEPAETIIQEEQQIVSPYQHIVIEGSTDKEEQQRDQDLKNTDHSSRKTENNKLYLHVIEGSSLGLVLVGVFLKLFGFMKQIQP